MIDKLFKLKSLGNQKKQWHGVRCNWSLKEQLLWNDIQNQFYWVSLMSDILLQFNWESKNTMTSIYFFLRIGTGIIDKLFQLKSLENQKKH